MKKFLLICVLLAPGLAWSQAQLDSLYAVWQDESQPDSNRASALHDYIRTGPLSADLDSALYLAKELETFSREQGYERGQSWGLFLQGYMFFNQKKFAEAIPLLEKAIEIQEGIGDSTDMARSLTILAISENGQRNFSRSVKLHQRALDIHQKLGNQQGVAGSLINIGNNYNDQRDFERALQFYLQGMQICEEIGAKMYLANVVQNIGLIYSRKEKYTLAIPYYERALALREEMGNHQYMVYLSLGLANICKLQGDYPKAFSHCSRALTISEESGYVDLQARSTIGMGTIYFAKGDYPQALQHYQKGLVIAEKLEDPGLKADALNSIGLLYDEQQENSLARSYYLRSLTIYQKSKDQDGIAGSLINIGNTYLGESDWPKALEYYQRGVAICEKIDAKTYLANGLTNIGSIYDRQDNPSQALAYYQRALAIRQQLEDKKGTANALAKIGAMFQSQGNYAQAMDYCQRAWDLSQAVKALQEERLSCECLYRTYKALGNSRKALQFHEQWTVLQDSLFNEANTKEIAQLEARYTYQKQALADSIEFAKQAQIKDLQIAEQQASLGQQRIALGAVLIGLALLGALAYAIFRGKKRSDELLLNILPAETAAELKATGAAAAKEYEKVSVLFSDFIGFTQLAERLSAAELVAEINVCFKAFDEIMATYGLEKIKTIGDAYMAAGGLPDPLGASARDVVHAGLAMQQFIMQRKAEREAVGLPFFEMRVGIHTGPVIAGVVGIKKFQYDVWGDTVNTASRMESNGQVGEVNISAATHTLLQGEPELSFAARGAIAVKGKGQMQMYFVRIAPDQAEAEAHPIEKLS